MCPAASVAFWWTNTKVSPAARRSSTMSSRRARSASALSDSGASIVSSPTVFASPRRNADSPMNVPRRPCRSLEGRHAPRPSPPLQRHDVEHRQAVLRAALRDLVLGEQLHRPARPLLGRARGSLRLGHERLRPQHRVAVAEERVGVGDALVGLALDPQHRLAAPDVLEREEQPVDLEPVARVDERLRVGGVALRVGTAGQPPAVVAPLGRPQRRVREDVLGRDLLVAPERLEDRAPGKLVRPVAEHRPVRDLARGRAPGADGVEQPARAGGGEAVEVRRAGGLVGRAPLEDVVRAVGEAVEENDDDRVHVSREPSGWFGL